MSTSSKATSGCRCCGNTEHLADLGFCGQLAPFFLKRVFGIRLGTVRSPSAWKQAVRRLLLVPQNFLQRLNRSTALVQMQICQACSFVQTTVPFAEDAINRLYLDYREPSYNAERIAYEPTYAAIAADVGHSPVELESRLGAATTFLTANMPATRDLTILDFGGSDGKFMPRLDAQKFVFEISNVAPVAGVTRINSVAELGTYGLVQLAHVIEHVVDPLSLVTFVTGMVAPGGFLYIETPQELTDEQRAELQAGRRTVTIHEHINSLCPLAVTRLMEAAGLRLVAIEASPVNVGWAQAVHIRALGQKA